MKPSLDSGAVAGVGRFAAGGLVDLAKYCLQEVLVMKAIKAIAIAVVIIICGEGTLFETPRLNLDLDSNSFNINNSLNINIGRCE